MASMSEAISLAAAIGRRIRQLRDERGFTQGDVAHAARIYGLGWTRATVAAIESGARNLSAEELVLLPVLIGELTAPSDGTWEVYLELRDLIPDDDRDLEIDLAPGEPGGPYPWPWHVVRAILSSQLADAFPASPRPNEDLDLPGEVEERAAVRLGVPVDLVMEASYRLWGHSLTAERDRLMQERGGDITPSTRRAIRGRITRELVKHLQVVLVIPPPGTSPREEKEDAHAVDSHHQERVPRLLPQP
jgi:transcriptional regulator with XRE-family HTH domain